MAKDRKKIMDIDKLIEDALASKAWPDSRYLAPRQVGLVRAVFEKVDDRGTPPWLDDVELLYLDAFDTELTSGSVTAPMCQTIRLLNEFGVEERLSDEVEELEMGVYELVGEVWYEYDPGQSTPNGPAEPDAHVWLEECQLRRLTDEQAARFIDDGEAAS